MRGGDGPKPENAEGRFLVKHIYIFFVASLLAVRLARIFLSEANCITFFNPFLFIGICTLSIGLASRDDWRGFYIEH